MRLSISFLIAALLSARFATPAAAEFDVSPAVVGGRIVTHGWDDEASTFVSNTRVFGYEFGEDEFDPFRIQDPGFNAFSGNGLPQGSLLHFDILSDLRYWTGEDDVVFGPVDSAETLSLRPVVGTPNERIAGTGTGVAEGFALGTVAAGGSLHRHLESTLNPGGGRESPNSGLYIVELRLRSSAPEIAPSLPFFVIYNAGGGIANHEQAIEWVQTNLVPFGDFDRDHSLTAADLPAMLDALTSLTAYQAENHLSDFDLLAFGDINADGRISNADVQPLLNLIAENEGGGSLSAVPEPIAIGPFVIGAVAMLFAKRQNLQRKFS
jgi:hypothetical protein